MTLAIDTQGLHPASALCMEALQWLHARESFRNIAEIGCGNGVLSLTAASIWNARVTAGDIAADAVADTRENLARHGIESVTVVRSDGFAHAEIRRNAPYQLIIANLLAELLVRFAPEVRSHLAPGGYVLVSGILAWKRQETLDIYSGLGFEISKESSNSPWHCYILRHKSKT